MMAEVPSIATVFGTILDKRELRGRTPGSISLSADKTTAQALATLFSKRVVTTTKEGSVKLNLRVADLRCQEQFGRALDELLYAALDRSPRDPAAESAELDAQLHRGLAKMNGETDASRAFLVAELASQSESRRVAQDRGLERALSEADKLVRTIDAALANSGPIRIANFAANILGDSKALGIGSDRLRRLSQALLDHHELTYQGAWLGAMSNAQALRSALEVNGICRDEAAITVYCFGPLVYRKRGQPFDHVLQHAKLGDVSALTLSQLHHASLESLEVDRVLVIENQTPFLDYIDHIREAPLRELVVLGRGQANWAVVQLLRLARRARIPIEYCGDLDRSGVLILRSLEHRVAGPLSPVAMDVATHRRFASRGVALTEAEAKHLRVIVERDTAGARCRDLLREILQTGTWIEQEHFFGEILLASGHDASL